MMPPGVFESWCFENLEFLRDFETRRPTHSGGHPNGYSRFESKHYTYKKWIHKIEMYRFNQIREDC